MSAVDAVIDAMERAMIEAVAAGFRRRATELRLLAFSAPDKSGAHLRHAHCLDDCAAGVAELLHDIAPPSPAIPSSVAVRIPPFNESAL